MKQTNSTDFLDLLSCIGDGFTLFAYALAIACSLQEEKNVVDASISEEKPGETLWVCFRVYYNEIVDKFTLKKLPSFSVVGIEGSSHDGPDFVAQLWDKAEKKIADVLPSLKIRNIFPIYWGLMSDNSRSFKPWENDFSEGIYLAGFELADDRLIPPEGWSKWDVPAQTYFVLPLDGDYKETLHQGLKTIQANGYVLSAAIFDHGEEGKMFLYFPVEVAS